MKRKIIALLLLLAALAGLLSGCGAPGPAGGAAGTVLDQADAGKPSDAAAPMQDSAEVPDRSLAPTETAPEETKIPAEEKLPEGTGDPVEENAPDSAAITEDGEYSSPEDVAEYIHAYGKLPGNFITKNKARDLGWDSSRGNLWDVAPGKSIGGDRFGNYEGLLPEGRYRECDVNYTGGYRGPERLIYGEDGSVWYTSDHYQSFTQLY